MIVDRSVAMTFHRLLIASMLFICSTNTSRILCGIIGNHFNIVIVVIIINVISQDRIEIRYLEKGLNQQYQEYSSVVSRPLLFI